MGRTDSFFPGSVKAAWEEALAAAAEADEAAAEDDALSAAAEALGEAVGVGVGVGLVALEVALMEDDVGDGVTGTLLTPLTVTAGFEAVDPLALAAELDGVAGTLDTPLTCTAGFEAVDPLAELVVVVALVDEVFVDPADDPPSGPPPVLVPPLTPQLSLSNVKVHSFTSSTSGTPFTVMGVKVITHVSVA